MKYSRLFAFVFLAAFVAFSAPAKASTWGLSTVKQIALGGFPAAVVAGDYNGDGMPDLVTIFHKKNGSVVFVQGDGKGGVVKKVATATTGDPVYLVGGDFDNDGKLDVIVSLFDNNALVNLGRIAVFLGNGDGTFRNYKADPNSPLTYTVGIRPVSIAVADFNGDTNPDLTVANFDDGTITVFFGDGTGSFTQGGTFPCGPHPRHLVTADVNGDGRLDLVVTNFDSDTVTILYGDGTGGFTPLNLATTITFPLNSKPWGVAAADLDKDGRVDLAVTESGRKKLALLFQNSTTVGKFNPPVEMVVPGGPDFVLATDIDQDGTTDLIVANGGGNNMTVFRGLGKRAFEAAKTFQTGAFPIHIVTADMNRDGDPDIITANINGSSLSDFLAKEVGKGVWGFAPFTDFAGGSWPAGLTAGAFTNLLTVNADFNRDGKPDVADIVGNTVVVTLDVSGVPVVKPAIAVGNGPSAIVAGDINRDGKPDIAVANLTDGTVSVLLGNGDGTFQAIKNFAVGLSPASMAIGSFGAPNGYLDIAVSSVFPPNETTDTVSVLFGREQFHVITLVNDPIKGTVTPVTGDYEANKDITFTATPTDPNLYKFTGWSGAFTGTQNPKTIVLKANITVKANFGLK